LLSRAGGDGGLYTEVYTDFTGWLCNGGDDSRYGGWKHKSAAAGGTAQRGKSI
jgi:hypothetical protein